MLNNKDIFRKTGAGILSLFLAFSAPGINVLAADEDEAANDPDIVEPEKEEEKEEQPELDLQPSEDEDQKEETKEEESEETEEAEAPEAPEKENEEISGSDAGDRVIAVSDYMIEDGYDADSAKADGESHDRYFVGEIKDDDGSVIGYRLTTVDYPAGAALAEGEEPFEIIGQPEDVAIEWPDGATFEVEVNRPDDVDLYQWCLFDGINVYILDGITAHQPKLVIPSQEYFENTYIIYCDIRDKDGHWYTTDDAGMSCLNPDEYKRVFFLGEYAIQPGETFNLEDYGIGSGTVIYDENGIDLTLDNVKFVNDKRILFDSFCSVSGGFLWSLRRKLDDDYMMHIKGDCSFTNHYFDESYLSSGVTGNIFFARRFGDESWPNVFVEGDGKLTINGGEFGLYCDGDLDLECDYEFNGFKNDGKQSGIHTDKNLTIGNGLDISIDCMGSGLDCDGSLIIFNDTNIDIQDKAIVTPGATWAFFTGAGIGVQNDIYCGASNIRINLTADADDFVDGWVISGFHGLACFGESSFNGSQVYIDVDFEGGGRTYAGNIRGFNGLNPVEPGSIYIGRGALMSINVDAPSAFGVTGLASYGDLTVDEGASLLADARGENGAKGIAIEGNLAINNSFVSGIGRTSALDPEYLPEEGAGYFTAGIAAEDVLISFDKCDERLVAYAEDEVDPETAMALVMARHSQDVEGNHLFLTDNVELVTPEDGAFGAAPFDIWDEHNEKTMLAIVTPDDEKPMTAVSFAGAFHDWEEWKTTVVPTTEKEGLETRTCKFCHKEETRTLEKLDPKDVYYEAVKGAGQEWAKGSKTAAEFTFKRSLYDETAIEHFKTIKVDGKDVDAKNFEAKAGSIIITLKPEYLETLAVGEHTLTASFDDGKDVSVKFVIKEASKSGGSSKSNANTGDTNKISFWLSMAVCAIMLAGCAFGYRATLKEDEENKASE